MKALKNITKETFSPYGFILDFSKPNPEGWEILTTTPDRGWRIAILEIDRKKATRLERHPDSLETFEPLEGQAILLTARNNPDDFEAFLLDRPVCLYRGVWHEVISLTEKAKLKITENNKVSCRYYNLPTAFGIRLDFITS